MDYGKVCKLYLHGDSDPRFWVDIRGQSSCSLCAPATLGMSDRSVHVRHDHTTPCTCRLLLYFYELMAQEVTSLTTSDLL